MDFYSMFMKAYAFLMSADSVDDVLKDFNKTVQRLDALQEVKLNEASLISEQMSHLQKQHALCTFEATRAASVSDKLSALLS